MTLLQSIIAYFINPVISFLIFMIFASVIMSWLVSFGIINLRNPTMRQIYNAVERITNPILEPIRRILPSVGGLDFSPIVAFLGLSWVQGYVLPQLSQMVGTG